MKIAALLVVAGLAATANAQLSLVANNSRTWIDISATGTALGSPNLGDDGSATITGAAIAGDADGFTGNALFAGGVDVRVNNNGFAMWNNSANGSSSFTNGAVSALPVVRSIAPFWDDLFGTATNGTRVRWDVVPGGTLVISWTDEDHFSAQGTGTISFQLQIYSGTNGGAFASFVYLDTTFAAGAAQNNGGSATIGYRADPAAGPGLTNDVQWAAANTANQVIGLQDGAGTAAQPNAIDLVPTPGAAALLGLGALAAGRRRR